MKESASVFPSRQVSSFDDNALNSLTRPHKRNSEDLSGRLTSPPVIPPIPSEGQIKKRAKFFAEEDESTPMEIENVVAESVQRKIRLASISSSSQRQLMFQTPFEFIEYLQSNPAIKEFAYGIPKIKSASEPFNPYDLKLVEYSDIDKSTGYYTISRNVYFQTKIRV